MPIRPLSIFAILFSLLFTVTAALAEGTRTWEQSKFDDLVKGTPKGVAIRSSGGLELAPALNGIYTSPSTYIWSIAADNAGNIFAATGAPARIYRVTPDGKSTVIFEPTELQVQALVVDKAGILYAATAPDGKVYRIEHTTAGATSKSSAENSKSAKAPAEKSDAKPEPTPVDSSWSATVYFDPKTKYIWDLVENNAGDLYLATGDHGEIYRVTPKGESSLFFKSDEVHIRVLAVDPNGNLIAGSDGSGLVYRISPNGTGFVLYSAPKKEITALAIDSKGNIYAAGAGEKRPGSIAPQIQISVSPAGPGAAAAAAAAAGQPGVAGVGPGANPSPMMGPFPAPGAGATGGSEIYRIAADGSPTRLWTSREDLVYALAFDQHGTLLAGTGNRGHVFAIYGEDNFSDLLRVGATQVTAFAPAPSGGLYLSTSNFGKLFLLGPAPNSEGTYESDVFDAHIFSRWGRAEFRGSGNVELFSRSGNVDNPDRNWSPWTKVDLAKGEELKVPAARFVQWKATLRTGTPAPRVDSVLLNYLPKNVAPGIDDVTVQVGYRFQVLPKMSSADIGAAPGQPHFDQPIPAIRDRDSIGVKWSAHDDNDDQLVYSVYYRGDGQSRWLPLKETFSDRSYSFDASLLPDGGYTVKVIASDAPSHSPGDALTTEKESSRFEVDSTPPQVQNLNAAVEGGQIHVTFRAADSFSPIKRAEYSIDAGDWQFVEPADQISDSKTENYDFKAQLPSSEKAKTSAEDREHVVVVRIYDRYENQAAAKFVIVGK